MKCLFMVLDGLVIVQNSWTSMMMDVCVLLTCDVIVFYFVFHRLNLNLLAECGFFVTFQLLEK